MESSTVAAMGTAGSPLEWYSKRNTREELCLEKQMHFYGRAATRELLQYGAMNTGTIEPLSKNELAEMGIHPTCKEVWEATRLAALACVEEFQMPGSMCCFVILEPSGRLWDPDDETSTHRAPHAVFVFIHQYTNDGLRDRIWKWLAENTICKPKHGRVDDFADSPHWWRVIASDLQSIVAWLIYLCKRWYRLHRQDMMIALHRLGIWCTGFYFTDVRVGTHIEPRAPCPLGQWGSKFTAIASAISGSEWNEDPCQGGSCVGLCCSGSWQDLLTNEHSCECTNVAELMLESARLLAQHRHEPADRSTNPVGDYLFNWKLEEHVRLNPQLSEHKTKLQAEAVARFTLKHANAEEKQAEKAAKKQAEESARLEKAAKKQAEEAEKAAKKQAEEAARLERIARWQAEDAEKAARKQAEKAEKAAKKQAEEAEKAAR